MHVIYQTRETVFHWDIQIPRRELKKTMPSGIFLMKFEVFGRQTFTLQKLEHLRNIQSLHGLNDSKLLCSIPLHAHTQMVKTVPAQSLGYSNNLKLHTLITN